MAFSSRKLRRTRAVDPRTWGLLVAGLLLAGVLPVVAGSATGSAGKILITGAFNTPCDTTGAQMCLLDPATRAVTPIPNSSSAQEPTVTRDGKRIAFVTIGSGTASLEVMNRDGSGLHAIVSDYAQINHPSWSPDGK